jgi:hypothetical protein
MKHTQFPDDHHAHDLSAHKSCIHRPAWETSSQLSEEDFEWWWKEQKQNSELLKKQCQALVRTYQLNPLMGELSVIFQGSAWVTHITMDGWMKMVNQHPAFCGIDFLESTELIEGIPAWMSCTIYRNDRVIPIIVKEYYLEVKTEGALWHEIPRRLLRFRALQQCARLALSLSSPEYSLTPIHGHHTSDTSIFVKKSPPPSSFEILKQHLKSKPTDSCISS